MVPVNWRAMETEELGSVYESLLELQPQLGEDGKTLVFASEAAEQKGNQRKTTGSYYTPDSLVQALLDTALDPVLGKTEAEADDPANALLKLSVIDPACGSGHFLLAAARRKDLPKTTEAERLVVQRIGQDIFRVGLIEYWQGRCPMTGITDTALLRASHIVPWKDCASDAERLDVHNGLLLSALWDAAFDRGLVTFDDEGQPQFSPFLSDSARAELRWQEPILLTDKHRRQLTWHRTNLFVRQGGA